jgi:hypothetical protein
MSDIEFQGKWEGKHEQINMGMIYLLQKHRNSCAPLDKNREALLALTYYFHPSEPGNNRFELPVQEDWCSRFTSCERKSNIQFIFFPFIIVAIGDPIRHMNALIFNKRTKEVFQYEPYGEPHRVKLDELSKFIEGVFPKYKFWSICNTCNKIGFQNVESKLEKNPLIDAGGYCAAWSLFFIDLMLTFPTTSPAILQQRGLETLEYDPVAFRQFIRTYSNFLLHFKNTVPMDIVQQVCAFKKQSKRGMRRAEELDNRAVEVYVNQLSVQRLPEFLLQGKPDKIDEVIWRRLLVDLIIPLENLFDIIRKLTEEIEGNFVDITWVLKYASPNPTYLPVIKYILANYENLPFDVSQISDFTPAAEALFKHDPNNEFFHSQVWLDLLLQETHLLNMTKQSPNIHESTCNLLDYYQSDAEANVWQKYVGLARQLCGDQ